MKSRSHSFNGEHEQNFLAQQKVVHTAPELTFSLRSECRLNTVLPFLTNTAERVVKQPREGHNSSNLQQLRIQIILKQKTAGDRTIDQKDNRSKTENLGQ